MQSTCWLFKIHNTYYSFKVDNIFFFQFLVGRLLEHISQVHFSSKMIIVTYLISKVTLITFGKAVHFHTKENQPDSNQPEKVKPFENLAQFDPKVQVLDILGPAGRRYFLYFCQLTTTFLSFFLFFFLSLFQKTHILYRKDTKCSELVLLLQKREKEREKQRGDVQTEMAEERVRV